MRPLLLSLALLALAVASRADDFNIGIGTLSIQVPAGWTVAHQSQGNVLTLILSPKNQANAQAFLTVSTSSNALSTAAEDQKFAAICQQSIHQAGEQKVSPQPYKLAQGHGTYAVFTDTHLVGKPPKPHDYKFMSVGLIQLNEFVEVFALIGADDVNGPEMTALRSAVESISLTPLPNIGNLHPASPPKP